MVLSAPPDPPLRGRSSRHMDETPDEPRLDEFRRDEFRLDKAGAVIWLHRFQSPFRKRGCRKTSTSLTLVCIDWKPHWQRVSRNDSHRSISKCFSMRVSRKASIPKQKYLPSGRKVIMLWLSASMSSPMRMCGKEFGCWSTC